MTRTRPRKSFAARLYVGALSFALLVCLSTRTYADACGNTPNFIPGKTFDVGNFLRAAVTGDFNGDANPDIAVPNLESNYIYVMLGDGAGGFSTITTYIVENRPNAIALGDFNGDQKTDLAVSSVTSGPFYNPNVFHPTVSILSGNGLGGFSLTSSFLTGGLIASSLAVADFNGDGQADLALEDRDGTGVLSLRLGDGKGNFTAAGNITLGGGAPERIIARDLNGDDRPDIVATDTIGYVLILINNGAGGFIGPTRFGTGAIAAWGPTAVVAGDFNSDGKIDLAVANEDSSVAILPGDGAGGFGSPNRFTTGVYLSDIASGDFNGDGKTDFAVTSSGTDNYSSKQVVVILGDGLGGFAGAASFDIKVVATSVVVADFNRDARPDLLFSRNGVPGVALLLNDCGAGPTPLPGISVNDITVAEGNDPVAYPGIFTVTLSSPSAQRVAVSYTLAGGLTTPPYTSSGVIIFPPGQTVQTIGAPVQGDSYDGYDQTFTLDLSSPIGATIVRSHATCNIMDDDPAPTVSFFGTPQFSEGDSGTINAFIQLKVVGSSRKPLKVDYATADGTAVAGSDYLSTSGTLSFNAGGTTFESISVQIKGDTTNEPNETFLIKLSNPVNVTIEQGMTTATIFNDDTPTVQFSPVVNTVTEGVGFVNINVVRTGDKSAPATVKYATSDTTDANFRCDPTTAGQPTGVASRKCDYHMAVGTLRFAANETSQQITLSIVDDVYVEGTETFTVTLSNPTGTALGQSTALVRLINNDMGVAPNPIDNTRFFVRQLYVDLLSREPDPAGWNGWTTRIDQCGLPGQPPPPCDRVTVGGDGFLRSGEFFDRQFFVLRLYRAGFGRILRYDEVGDLAFVSGFLTAEQLELNKRDLVNELVLRPEFAGRYNPLSNAAFVATMLQTADVSVPQSISNGWIASLDADSKSRAQVFREISERPEVSNKYLHEAQVVSAYYGFFTRNPDGAYLSYLQRLDSGEINLADLANAFINAQEYRQRFGQ